MNINGKFMYVGPTIPGVARRNSVYDGMPDGLKKAIEQRPYLAGLCIPSDKLAPAMRQLNLGTGGVCTLYKRAEAEMNDIQKGVK